MDAMLPDVGWPFGRVRVAGLSMAPTLLPGDFLVVRRSAPPRVGTIVVARRPDRPGLLVVKRVTARGSGGYWLVGDNPLASDDSEVFGPVPEDAVLARVFGCYWPLGRARPL